MIESLFMKSIDGDEPKIVFWHRDLPPLSAELVAEHTVEANSSRVPGTLAHRDDLWDRCYRELMANTQTRLVEELARLGGHFAHVHDEAIVTAHVSGCCMRTSPTFAASPPRAGR